MRKRILRGARESALARGWTVEGDEPTTNQGPSFAEQSSTPVVTASAETAEQDPAGGVGAADGMSNAVIVLLGAFGGLYLLYSWGWFIVAQAYSAVNTMTAAGSGIVGGVLQEIIFWAAPVAPLAWLLTAILLTRGRGSGRLALALVIGAIVLVPVPMLVLGVVA